MSADLLSSLRRVTGVHAEPLPLREPFVEVVRRFAGEPGTVALLSGGTLDCARYHILGVRPWLTVSGQRARTTLTDGDRRYELDEDPFTTVQRLLRHNTVPAPDASLPLSSGLLGYLAYDLKDCLEQLPRTSVDDLGLPLMHLVAPTLILVQDRVTEAATLLVMRVAGDDTPVSEHVTRFREALRAPAAPRAGEPAATGRCESAFSRDEYLAAVEAIRRYIVEGDVYQVNMSQRFQAPFTGDPFDCFAGMFAENPAPFFAYVNAGDHQIVSTSPERFVELRNGTVETRPIKGTRPRGTTPERDDALRAELRESTKDDAELSMIVDLLRNDIGKVCRPGSVRVLDHKRLETYRNVHHLVSTVTGELAPGRDAVDLLRATFPGGSITGCPKIRAMEVIDELEPVRRHIYTGSIGYLGFDGTMDLSIAIRTATFTGGTAVFSVGGGIVFDSDAASEYEETLHKGRTLMNALHAASGDDRDTATVWQDGIFKPAGAATVRLDSEGLSYGLGFFETLRVRAGRPILLDAHLRRFELAWREFFGSTPPDVTWADVIARLVERNGLSGADAVVKLVAAAGNPAGARLSPVLFAAARPYVPRPALRARPGLRLMTYPHRRETYLAGHKTLNYLHYRMAGAWAAGHGADEALILNADGSVSETNTASLCCVAGETAVFPVSEHALPGTMAAEVGALLRSWGHAVEHRRLSVADLMAADHVFVTNSVMGAVPVISLDDARLGYDVAFCEKLTRAVFEDGW
ncbi:aminodeoxychorismate synthase component I [Actinoplanes oblitus]|uniref:aminodeoxychorismate synthase n=1 Tax=Actinoplanes oblitus TaxID=3040509 RepID=A0ABY8WU38_9ACTN|nr:aminodeoxychorismate synthase component I [Actinoplanes oblitus]WIN00446.1 aminodeoxychorismate synthase component I [Actinoplanes oblitus]